MRGTVLGTGSCRRSIEMNMLGFFFCGLSAIWSVLNQAISASERSCSADQMTRALERSINGIEEIALSGHPLLDLLDGRICM